MNNEKIMVEYLPITQIEPYPNNPRHNDDAVDAVASSIREFGFKVPIIIDENNVIIAGHTRLKAAKQLGMTEVPVIRASDLTEDQVKAFRLADNKVGELATWDLEMLDEELAGIDIDMTEFGFDDIAETEIEDIIEDEPTEDAPPVAKQGDIWQLGDHRLMCGDSTDPEALLKLMDGERADMVFTDPPYGVAIGSKNAYINAIDPGRGGRVQEDIEGDTLDAKELYEMLVAAFTNLR